jgi:hypothetical protein
MADKTLFHDGIPPLGAVRAGTSQQGSSSTSYPAFFPNPDCILLDAVVQLQTDEGYESPGEDISSRVRGIIYRSSMLTLSTIADADRCLARSSSFLVLLNIFCTLRK